jgi:putative two-component system response regulator
MADIENEVKGFQMGVIDFVSKPFSPPVLTNRIKTHLDIDAIIRERTAEIQKKTELLEQLQNAVVLVLADIVESRDKSTGGHVERTSLYIQVLIEEMMKHDAYAGEISALDLDLLSAATKLHDVGKISISDTILNKPGKLTPEEFEVMKGHTLEGERIIDRIVNKVHNVEDFLKNAKQLAGAHHERWDGTGYPRGLQKHDIPLLGRVMAVVDVYDALVSERPYKEAFTTEKAVQIIMENSGTQFDPDIADLFYSVRDKFEKIGAEVVGVEF